jgi:hypothetical protein
MSPELLPYARQLRLENFHHLDHVQSFHLSAQLFGKQASDREVSNVIEHAWSESFLKTATVVELKPLRLNGLKDWKVVVGLHWILVETYSAKMDAPID